MRKRMYVLWAEWSEACLCRASSRVEEMFHKNTSQSNVIENGELPSGRNKHRSIDRWRWSRGAWAITGYDQTTSWLALVEPQPLAG